MAMKFDRVVMNLQGATKRYETLNGKQYLVVPTVMMTEGVRTGSEGPKLYLKENMGKNPQVWNHKPVVIYHPTMDGLGISACDPAVIEKQGVGTLFNSDCDDKLKTESWIDEEKLKKVDKRVYEALQNNQMVEVSTGFFHDEDKTPGTWKDGSTYSGTITNIYPDHLAILPDQKGACSIADGGGLLRNAEGEDVLSYDDIREQLRTILRTNSNGLSGDYCYICDLYPKFVIYEKGDESYKVGYKVKSGKVSIVGEAEKVRKQTSYVTANGRTVTINEEFQGPVTLPPSNPTQLSDVVRKNQLQQALNKKYSGVVQEGDWGGWVTEMYSDYVVWIKDGKTFRLPYTYDDDKITFGTEPEEEVKAPAPPSTTPIDGTQSPYTINKEPTVATVVKNAAVEIAKLGGAGDSQTRTTGREDSVNKMIASGKVGEEARAHLMSLPDDGFTHVEAWVMRGATQPTVPYGYTGVGDRSNVHNQQPQVPMTVNSYVQQAPPEIQEFLTNAIQAQNEQRTKLVNVILSNKGNAFSKEWLLLQKLDLLKGMASLGRQAQAPVSNGPNYGGQGDVPMFNAAAANDVLQNAADDTDVLAMPVMTFDPPASRTRAV